MRTTINLPDGLAEAAKAKATAEGRTFTSVVEEGLRAVLEAEPAGDPVVLPAYGTPGGKVLVDILDREALWAVLDGVLDTDVDADVGR
ncbi:MAG: CopG family transcriptional regulator [Acidimicrobiales bacterium]